MNTEKIKLGKIVIKIWSGKDFHSTMKTVLAGRKYCTSSAFLYHFNNEKIVSDEIFYGELFKTRLSGEHVELVSDISLKYQDKKLDELYEYVRFCIFPDHSIIMTSKSNFNSDEFIKKFSELFKLNSPEFVRLDIRYVRDDYDIFEIIDNFDKMIEVTIKELRKSNPSPKPTFEKIEKFLENENVDEYSAGFKSDDHSSSGLQRNLNSHIMSAISLTDSGYGESQIIGLKDGEMITIKSKDKIIQSIITKLESTEFEEFIKLAWTKFQNFITYELRG